MTETAQLALITVLGTFLTGLVTLGTIYLNRFNTKLSQNTTATNEIHTMVNGEKTAMLAEIARLRKKYGESGIYPQEGVSQ